MDLRAAHAVLTLLDSDAALAAQVAREGAIEVVSQLRAGHGRAAHVAAVASRGVDAGERMLDHIHRIGGHLRIPGDLGWPASLQDLADPPVALWVRGRLEPRPLLLDSVAIVGARAATPYGERIALGMAHDLASSGATVISGGAIGIDAAAHRGALVDGGSTLAVLACGVDVVYPRAHDALFAQILEQGSLVSEVAPGRPVHRHQFLRRNRLIASLSRGTVVVEAALRSGALSTAAHARALGRHVMAVPGPVTNLQSLGCHALLRDGATLVADAAQVRELIAPLTLELPESEPVRDVRDDLDADTRTVLEAFPARRGITVARLLAATGLPLPTVAASLGAAEHAGLIERQGEQWRLSATARTPTSRS